MKNKTSINAADANVARLALRFLMERQRAEGFKEDQALYVAAYLAISADLFGFASLPAIFQTEAFEPTVPAAWFAGMLPAFHPLTRRVVVRWIKHLQRQRNRIPA